MTLADLSGLRGRGAPLRYRYCANENTTDKAPAVRPSAAASLRATNGACGLHWIAFIGRFPVQACSATAHSGVKSGRRKSMFSFSRRDSTKTMRCINEFII